MNSAGIGFNLLHKAISRLDLPRCRVLVDVTCGIGSLKESPYTVRYASTPKDVERAQRLRHLAFRSSRGAHADPDGLDRDEFDEKCIHVLIEEAGSGNLVCCFRLMALRGGSELNNTYSAKYYGLSNLKILRRANGRDGEVLHSSGGCGSAHFADRMGSNGEVRRRARGRNAVRLLLVRGH